MTTRPLRFLFAPAPLCLALALAAQPPQTPPRPAPSPAAMPAPDKSPDEMVSFFKLPDGDVDSMLEALKLYSGRDIIRPGTLPISNYSLVIDNPIPKSELIQAIESSLELNQIGVIPLGDRFFKVVPLAVAKNEAPPFIEGSTLNLPPSNRIASKVFVLQFLRATEFFGGNLVGTLSPGLGNGVVVMDKANGALVTDTISNLQRIEKLIEASDRPSTAGLTPKFYTLHNAKASDLVTKLHSILSGSLQTELGTATTYNADDRTNQVIVLTDPRMYPTFDELIAKIDVKSDPNTRNEVIYLKHADAQTLQTTLSNVIAGQNTAAQKSQANAVRPGENANIPAVPVPGPLNPVGPSGVAAAGAAGSGTGNQEFSSLITVVADERSNAIVVSGTIDDIRLIKELVEKIDISLAQVRIEVIIAEVTLDDKDQSGITALGLTVGQNAAGATHVLTFAGGGTASTATTTTTGTAINTSTTPATSIAGWDITNGIVNPLSFAAAFNPTSAGSKNLVKILSAPVIVTAHNKKAEVTVGENEPIITGSTATPTGAAGVSTNSTVTYQPIAIDMTVTPLIGDNGDVQLDIDQKVDDIIGETTIDGNQQPIIGHREAKSFVTVKDGEMIVLGGLQRTQKTENHDKIGFLYEIPIISQLLGGHADELQRTELLFFIRPHVVSTEESTADTKRHIDELTNKDQINRFLKNPTPPPKSETQNFLDRFRNN